VWWYTSVIPALRMLKKEKQKFKANLSYRVDSVLKKKTKNHWVSR
jgi:hypothetical protein